MKCVRNLCFVGMAALLACWGVPAQAATVAVGGSSLISTLDYSDTFTGTDYGGLQDRDAVGGYPLSTIDYPVNGTPGQGLAVENLYSNAANSWADAKFSIASDGYTLDGSSGATYPGPSGSGSNTGVLQAGGDRGDFGITYGVRNKFVAQYDAVQTRDRIGFSFGADRDLDVLASNDLFVFIRAAGTGFGAEISVANFTGLNQGLSFLGETDTGLTTGLTMADTGQWHNYAATVDATAKTIEVYVDQVSRGVINLNTLAGGAYAQYLTSQNVGLTWGDNSYDGRFWVDNLQVGAAVPEPGTFALLGSTLLGLLAYAWRRR